MITIMRMKMIMMKKRMIMDIKKQCSINKMPLVSMSIMLRNRNLWDLDLEVVKWFNLLRNSKLIQQIS